MRRWRTISTGMVMLLWLAGSAPVLAETTTRAADAGASVSVPGHGLVVGFWSALETLIALGHPPAGAADLGGYTTWVKKPALPEGIVDVGLRAQPNLELLSQLSPERILIPAMLANLTPLLSRIAKVEIVPAYSGESPLWEELRAMTRQLARYTPDPAAADTLIDTVETRLADLASELPDAQPAILVVQFMDDRHVRVFGDHSLYNAVLQRLGLATAWRGKTNVWGFSLVGIHALAEPDNLTSGPVRLVVVEPLPPGLKTRLRRGGLWQALPPVARGDVIYLPPVWSFGSLPSAQRFAELLTAALTPPEPNKTDEPSRTVKPGENTRSSAREGSHDG